MRILLLGEFSGLHKNLQIGLRAAGHEVDLVSGGDGFKAIYGDIHPPALRTLRPWDKVRFRVEYYRFLSKITGYDVVQLINPNVLLQRFFPYKKALSHIKENNGRVFLLAAGSDPFYWQKARPKLRYGPFEDVLKYDNESKTIVYETASAVKFNQYVADAVDGIIPIMYEYALAYENQPNVRSAIPLPIDVRSIKYKDNAVHGKLKVFHGLSRYGFKGTRHVEDAYEKLNQRYSDKIECTISGGMPLDQYVHTLESSNVVIDQVNTYSYGMNALYAAALGKVVLSGCEPECLSVLGIQKCPIINTLPAANNIENSIADLVGNELKLGEVSAASRRFVEDNHCCHLIASRYVAEWGG